jgi:hypothetical protein
MKLLMIYMIYMYLKTDYFYIINILELLILINVQFYSHQLFSDDPIDDFLQYFNIIIPNTSPNVNYKKNLLK